MNTGLLALWMVTGAVALTGLVTTGAAAARAQQHASAAQEQLRAVREQMGRLETLRNSKVEKAGQTPLAQRVGDALSSAGLPTGTLSNLSPESATTQRVTAAGPMTVRKRATLTLAPITLPQVGKFLSQWREQEPAWSVASVELAPEGGRVAPTGGDLPLRAVILLEMLSLPDPQSHSNPESTGGVR